MPTELQVGDLVAFRALDGGGVGIVSRPITGEGPGHVLTLQNEFVVGVTASLQDVEPADEGNEGFAQLAYHLIKLGSHVIEEWLIP